MPRAAAETTWLGDAGPAPAALKPGSVAPLPPPPTAPPARPRAARGNRDHSRMSFAASVKALASPRLDAAQRRLAHRLAAARRWLLVAICALGGAGMVTGIGAAQLLFWRCQLDGEPETCPARVRDGSTDALKALTTVTTVALLLALAAFKYVEVSELRLLGSLLPHESVLGSSFVAIMALCALHCPAGVYRTMTTTQFSVTIVYDYDSLLAIALAFRGFALLPLCIDEFAGMNSKSARVIERFNGVRLDVAFTVRLLIDRSPMAFALVFFAMTIVTFAVALHISERPVCQTEEAISSSWCSSSTMGVKDFSSFGNAVWNAIITALSVGYGDIFAVTQLGRFVAATTAVAGAINVATLISAVSRSLQLSAAESRATRAFARVALQNERRRVALQVLRRFLAIARVRLPGWAAAAVSASASPIASASPSAHAHAYASALGGSRAERRAALIARLQPISAVPRGAMLALEAAVHRFKEFLRVSLNAKNDVDDVVKLQYDLNDLRENVDKEFIGLRRQIGALHALVAQQGAGGGARGAP